MLIYDVIFYDPVELQEVIMKQGQIKVPFTRENIARCMCPKCPVQSKSACAASQLNHTAEALEKEPLRREEIPQVYCSTGTATCQDLNARLPCVCATCAVFAANGLRTYQPPGYYCTQGTPR